MDNDEDREKQTVSRRQLLKLLGVVSAAPIMVKLMPVLAAEIKNHSNATSGTGAVASDRMRQWVLVFDLRKCEGCVTIGKAPQCIEGCNAEHFVPQGQEWIKIFEMEGPGGHNYFLPRPCMQCENPPCLNVCPVGATYKNEEGTVLVNHDRCIGCRMCMAACPYAARVFNWTQPENPAGATFSTYSPEYPVPHRQGTVEKCVLHDRR